MTQDDLQDMIEKLRAGMFELINLNYMTGAILAAKAYEAVLDLQDEMDNYPEFKESYDRQEA